MCESVLDFNKLTNEENDMIKKRIASKGGNTHE